MKIKILLLVVLLLFSTTIPVGGQFSPIAVAGWIYLESGLPASSATVTVHNVNTGIYANTTTNINGQYVAIMSGANGNMIQVNCSHLGEAGINNTTVNLAKVTQFANLSLSPSAIPPDALFTYSQYNLEGILTPQGPAVTFRDYSKDVDGQIIRWSWTFGDDSTASSRNPKHTYEKDGIYRVTLVVTDNDGLTDRMRKTIEIITEERTISFPPIQIPLYPLDPYTIPEMYQLLRGDSIQKSNEEIIVVVIDTGATLRVFDDTNMNDIVLLHHPNYENGLDDNGHGTAVNSIVHYALEQWAPNSIQYSIKALDKNGECTPTVLLECFDMAKDLNPHIVTASIGKIGQPTDGLCLKVDELRNNGIIVTVAAGNSGPYAETILSPGCGEAALAIGSIDPRKTILDRTNDVVSVWSSRGPVPDIFPKPDMVAPGESILTAWRQNEKVVSGTSLSTPFVAGGAVMLYANNKGMLDAVKIIYGLFGMKFLPAQIIEEALAESCFDKSDMDSYGWGIVDIELANGIVFWKCLFWLLLFAGIIIAIVITILVLRWLYGGRKRRRKTRRLDLDGNSLL